MIQEIKKVKALYHFSLFSLINPIPKQDFLRENWEQEALIIKRNNRAYYQKLFTIEEVDRVLHFHRPTGHSIRIVKNQEPMLAGKYENFDGSLNLNQIYAAYSDGYTVVINEIERFHPAIKELCQKVREELHHHVVGNMYLTPPHQKALLPHYDTHDVLVIQVHGSKEWKIYDAPVETPLHNSFQPVFREADLSGVRTVLLEAGDFMYMPRGVPHHALTHDESSLHLTIGVHPKQWVDLLAETLQVVALQNKDFRKALPVGYQDSENFSEREIAALMAHFQQLMDVFRHQANPRSGFQLLKNKFDAEATIPGDGHFAQLDQRVNLTLESEMIVRSGLRCQVFAEGNVARISFPGNTIKGPSHIADALSYIAEAEGSFVIKDLPFLSDNNKLKLVQRLVRGGLLKLSPVVDAASGNF